MELGRDADFGLAESRQPRFVQASLLHDWQFATDTFLRGPSLR
jgi:hypothetical protein